ncbi:hypothetical protein [Nitrosomonas ureae]|nr:hypothetical protein [Nitrosomonas ureae]
MLRIPLSCRHLEEMMEERGVSVDLPRFPIAQLGIPYRLRERWVQR